MDADPIQGGLEGLLGSRVKHLAADGGRVRIPRDEDQFGGGTAIRRGEVQVDESVTAVIVGERATEIFEGLTTFTLFRDNNCLLVLDRKDDVTELFPLLQLEIVEGRRDLFRNFHSGSLGQK